MAEGKHTPGPWRSEIVPQRYPECDDADLPIYVFGPNGKIIALVDERYDSGGDYEANACLMAASPEMLEALRLHKAWADNERSGPDYGGQTRGTHPDGERIWEAWWGSNLDLCDRANRATDAAIAKAEGRS